MVRIKGCGERWDRVGVVASRDWRAVSQAVTRAAQVIACGGERLEWLDEPGALALVRDVPGPTLGIRVRAYTLVFLDADSQLRKTLPLGGATADEVSGWIETQGFPSGNVGDFPDTPSHAVLGTLDRTLSNVHETIGRIAHRTQGAGAARTDPTTLETSVRIDLSSREGESPRTIEVGFSVAGDQGELFVRLASGDGTERVRRLPMAEVTATSDVDAQAPLVERFFQESLEEAYVALRRQWHSRRPSSPP